MSDKAPSAFVSFQDGTSAFGFQAAERTNSSNRSGSTDRAARIIPLPSGSETTQAARSPAPRIS